MLGNPSEIASKAISMRQLVDKRESSVHKAAACAIAGLMLISCALILAPGTASADGGSQQKAAVAVTFDDGTWNQYALAYRQFHEAGMNATLFIPYDSQFIMDPITDPAVLREMQDGGWEIGSHSYIHMPLTELTLEGARENLSASQENLTVNGGYPLDVTTFCYPNSAENATLRSMAAEYYDLQRTSDGLEHYYTNIPESVRIVKGIEPTNLEMFKTLVDRAVQTGTLLVLIFHAIDDDGMLIDAEDFYGGPTDMYIQELTAYIKAYKDAGQLDVLRMNEIRGYGSASGDVKEWTGAGADNKMSTAANWKGGVAPVSGDNLVFTYVSSKDCVIDAAAPSVFGDIYVNDEYSGTISSTKDLTYRSLEMDDNGTWDGGGHAQTVTDVLHIAGMARLSSYSVDLVMSGQGTILDITGWQETSSVRIVGSCDILSVIWTEAFEVAASSKATLSSDWTQIIVHNSAGTGYFRNYGTIENGQVSVRVPTWFAEGTVLEHIRLGTINSDVYVEAINEHTGASADLTGAADVKSLTVQGGMTLRLNGVQLNVQEDLTVRDGSLLDGGTSAITVRGDWDTSRGVWNPASSSVTFYAGSNRISTNQTQTFRSLIIVASGDSSEWTMSMAGAQSWTFLGHPYKTYGIFLNNEFNANLVANADGTISMSKQFTSSTTTARFVLTALPMSLDILSPNDDELIASTAARVAWVVSPDAVSVKAQLDGGAWADVTSVTSKTFTGLSQGPHTVVIEAEDDAHVKARRSVTFIVDTVPPALLITAPDDNGYVNSSSLVVQFDRGDAVRVEVSLNGGEWRVANGSFVMFNGVDDGTYRVDVRAYDAAGNSVTKSVTAYVDTTPPTLTVTSPQDGRTYGSSTAVVNWNAGPGTVVARISLDGGAWTDVTGQTSKTFAGLSQGGHTVTVQAIDARWNVNQTTIGFGVDTIAPDLRILSPANDADVSMRLTVQLSIDDSVLVRMRVDDGPWTTVAGDSFQLELTGGGHVIHVQAQDAAGNLATASVDVNVDDQAPELRITSPSAAVLVTHEVTVSWEASGQSKVELSADGESWEDVSGLASKTLTLDDGSYAIYVRATDQVGNEATRTATFRVDTTPPTLSITSPQDGSSGNSSTVTVSWTAGTDTASAAVQVDGGEWLSATGSASKVLEALGEGAHTVVVRVADAYGNEAFATVSFTIDSQPPSLSVSLEDGALLRERSVIVPVSQGDAARTQYRLDGGEWEDFEGGSFELTYLQDGGHVVDVRAYDAAGNSATVSVTITVDATPPAVQIISPIAGQPFTTSSVTITWTSSEAAAFEISVDGGEFAPVEASPYSLTLEDGTHSVSIRATDAAGNSATATLAGMLVDSIVPEFVSVSPPSGSWTNNEPVIIHWAASEDVVSYWSWDGVTWAQLAANSVELSGLADGTYTVHLKIADAAGNAAYREVAFILDRTAPALEVTSIRNEAVVTSASITVEWAAWEGAVSAQVKLDEGDWAAATSLTSTDLSGLSEGWHVLQVAVTDGYGRQPRASVSFLVDSVPPLLTVDSPPDGSRLMSGHVMLGVESEEPAYCRVDGGEWALVEDGAVHLNLADGSHHVEIRSVDEAGNEALKSVHLQVDAAGHLIDVTGPTTSDDPRLTWADTGAGTTVQIKVDDGEWVDVPSGRTEHSVAGLGQGDHTAVIRITDVNGNSREETVAFTMPLDDVGSDSSSDGPDVGVFLGGAAIITAIVIVMLLFLGKRKE